LETINQNIKLQLAAKVLVNNDLHFDENKIQLIIDFMYKLAAQSIIISNEKSISLHKS
jgi:hypothetical protein